MAMLAEPRRKQRWTLNPRGKQWSDDSNKFGQKMLEKMGWSSGKGLGRNLDGMTEHIRARFKNDQGGIGYSNDDQDKQWTQHQEGFNELLQKLQGSETAEPVPKENELSGKSLELKSQQSRARVHYKKFTRGKDVNKYSTKDLANIFGKKDLTEKQEDPVTIKQEVEKDSEVTISDPVGTNDSSHGVVTIKGGSIADYFKNKMALLGRKATSVETNAVENEPESEDDRYVGFGFAGSTKKPENTFMNPAFEPDSSTKTSVTPGKRKSDYVFENPALEMGDSPKEMERTPKRRKREFAYENGGADLDLNASPEKTPNIEKTYKTSDESAINEEFLVSTESVESGNKRKRRKKSKEITVVNVGFVNEALNLETRNSVEENAAISQFEIPRPAVGLANDALDLSDESTGKKRVTFNDTVEYDTNVGKTRGKKRKDKNNAAKLDKFEVDNEKLKKKRRKEKSLESTATENAFTNEAMEQEIFSQEAVDNAVNERKMEKVRRKRRMSNLETIEEAPEEDREELTPAAAEVVTLDDSLVGETNESFESMSLDTPKGKKKKRSKRNAEKIEGQENDSYLVNQSFSDVEFIEEIQSTKSRDETKSKKQKKKKEPEEEEAIEMEIIVNTEDSEKKKKKRKKEPKTDEAYVIEVIEALDTSLEQSNEEKIKTKKKEKSKKIVDKENIEVILENTGIPEPENKRKKKQKKKVSTEKKETEEKASSASENVPENDLHVQDKNLELEGAVVDGEGEAHSPWDNRGKISKKIFKTLFMRSPVVHFAGSNINEIKGYGVDFN
ncbi:titin [Venturia canescens]|uniref:titin n=1 Tax=Venturia canescens TaxID=32260 RepID=UPI001C9C909A|nr:titin [Venturia canescens]